MVAIPPLIWNASLVYKKKIISLISYRIQTPIHRDRHSTHKKKNSLRNVIRSQYSKYIGHIYRCPNTTLTNKMFTKSRRPYKRDPWINIAKLLPVNVSIEQAKSSTQDKSGFAAVVDRVVASATPW